MTATISLGSVEYTTPIGFVTRSASGLVHINANQAELEAWAERTYHPGSKMLKLTAVAATYSPDGSLLDVEFDGLDDLPGIDFADWSNTLRSRLNVK